jgi:hypothetical protein
MVSRLVVVSLQKRFIQSQPKDRKGRQEREGRRRKGGYLEGVWVGLDGV